MALETREPTRYRFGIVNARHKGRLTTTSVGNSNQDRLAATIDTRFKVDVGFVPAGFEHRPDLISNVFYGTPANWWIILLANGIEDPFEGLNVNDRIVIPKI